MKKGQIREYDNNASLTFYKSCYEKDKNNVMCNLWLISYGLIPDDEIEQSFKLIKKNEKHILKTGLAGPDGVVSVAMLGKILGKKSTRKPIRKSKKSTRKPVRKSKKSTRKSVRKSKKSTRKSKK